MVCEYVCSGVWGFELRLITIHLLMHLRPFILCPSHGLKIHSAFTRTPRQSHFLHRAAKWITLGHRYMVATHTHTTEMGVARLCGRHTPSQSTRRTTYAVHTDIHARTRILAYPYGGANCFSAVHEVGVYTVYLTTLGLGTL